MSKPTSVHCSGRGACWQAIAKILPRYTCVASIFNFRKSLDKWLPFPAASLHASLIATRGAIPRQWLPVPSITSPPHLLHWHRLPLRNMDLTTTAAACFFRRSSGRHSHSSTADHLIEPGVAQLRMKSKLIKSSLNSVCKRILGPIRTPSQTITPPPNALTFHPHFPY